MPSGKLILSFCFAVLGSLLPGVMGMGADFAKAADVIVVCPAPMVAELSPWIEHRRRQQIQCVVIPPRPTAAQTLAAIRAAADPHTQYVMLVGDAPAIGTHAKQPSQVPIHYRPTTVTSAWGTTPTLSTDLPYGDLNGDGKTEVAVGRLPVDNATELRQAISKIIVHEQNSDFGPWRGQVSLIGGVGGFGTLVDTAIESVTRSIVTGVLPSEAQTHVRFGSPGHLFYPKASSFTQTVLDDYVSGSRFWVYAGHGQVTQLDRVPQTRQGKPVLDAISTRQLRTDDGNWPIALMLACYTGAMDASEDSIAETMWLHNEGPIAIIAGCRVTMPYGNTTAAIGLIDAVYQQRVSRLGKAWLSSIKSMQKQPVETSTPNLSVTQNSAASPDARTMIDAIAKMISPAGSDLHAQRCEHAQLYNLIGDPTLMMVHPEEVVMEIPSGFEPGSPLTLNLNSPVEGRLTLSIDRPLGTIPESVPNEEGDPNELTIASMTKDIASGQHVSLQIMLPSGTTGPLVVRAHVAGNHQWASASTKTRVRSPGPLDSSTSAARRAGSSAHSWGR